MGCRECCDVTWMQLLWTAAKCYICFCFFSHNIHKKYDFDSYARQIKSKPCKNQKQMPTSPKSVLNDSRIKHGSKSGQKNTTWNKQRKLHRILYSSWKTHLIVPWMWDPSSSDLHLAHSCCFLGSWSSLASWNLWFEDYRSIPSRCFGMKKADRLDFLLVAIAMMRFAAKLVIIGILSGVKQFMSECNMFNTCIFWPSQGLVTKSWMNDWKMILI